MFKHKEMLQAWLDGKQLQIRYEETHVWTDIPCIDESRYNPVFHSNVHIRIKKEIVKYRRFTHKLTGSGNTTISLCVYNEDEPKDIEKTRWFVRWIDTEWQEVEV